MKFSDEQRKFIILQFAKRLSAIATQHKFFETYAIWGKKKSKFTLTDFQREWQRFQDGPSELITNSGGRRKIRDNYYPSIATHYENNAKPSIRASSRALEIPSTNLWRILRQDLQFVPFKVNKLHKLSERNYEMRETFCLWFLSQDRNFHSIFFFGVTKNGGF